MIIKYVLKKFNINITQKLAFWLVWRNKIIFSEVRIECKIIKIVNIKEIIPLTSLIKKLGEIREEKGKISIDQLLYKLASDYFERIKESTHLDINLLLKEISIQEELVGQLYLDIAKDFAKRATSKKIKKFIPIRNTKLDKLRKLYLKCEKIGDVQ